MGDRRSGFGAHLRFGWDIMRFFMRRLIEYVVSVWLLAIAPLVAHLAAALQQPANRFEWIPNDLYLFLMVIGGSAAIETFQDRSSNGPMPNTAMKSPTRSMSRPSARRCWIGIPATKAGAPGVASFVSCSR